MAYLKDQQGMYIFKPILKGGLKEMMRRVVGEGILWLSPPFFGDRTESKFNKARIAGAMALLMAYAGQCARDD